MKPISQILLGTLTRTFAPALLLAATLPLTSPAQTINVDFNSSDGPVGTYAGTAAAPDPGTDWNAFVVGPEGGAPLNASVTSGPLATSTGLPTAITVTLGNFRVYEANERPAALAPALMTDFVYQQTLGNAGPDSTFSISNLNPSLTYDLYLYGQNGGYANTATIFTIGGVSKTATNAGNGVIVFTENVNYVLFSGLAPDASGTIAGTFNDAAPANNAAFCGLQIVQKLAEAKPVYVDFKGTDSVRPTYSGTAAAPDAGTTWNGFEVGPEAGAPLIGSVTSGPLVTATGDATPVIVSLGNFHYYEANENPAGLAPDLMTGFAYQQNLGPGGPNSTFSINNLDPALTYDLFLYAQNGGYASTATIFTIGGISQTATNAGNLVTTFTRGVNYVLFSGLVPDGAGTIAGTFNDAAPANNAAFNGLQIVKHSSLPVNVPPSITTQPVSQMVVEGDTVTFTVSAAGTAPLSYQWSKDGSPLGGQTSDTLTLVNVTTGDNGSYRVRVTNDFGFADSDPATLTVLLPAVKTINIDFNASDGTFGTYSGTAAAPDSGTTWNGFAAGPEGGSSLIGSATSSALVTSTGLATPVTFTVGNFRVYEANERPAALATALMTDFVYQQTLGNAGPNSTFSINNLDPLLTYNLYLYGQNGGYANTATIFTIGGVSKTAANAGDITTFTEGVNYVLFLGVAPDASGTISGTYNDAAPANNAAFNGLQIVQVGSDPTNSPPRIITQPISQTAVIEGDTVTFTVGAVGTAPLSYQWSKNGSPLAGQTAATLTLMTVTTSDNGLYGVQVSNAFGSTNSDPATLAVTYRRVAGIYSTGVDAGGTLAPDGSTDLHWILSSSADPNYPGPDAIVINQGSSPVPPWLSAGPKSKWIAPQPNQNEGNSPGDYTYQTFFDLTGVDPSTFRLTGQVAVDDTLVDIVVNGVSQGVAGGDFTSFLPFTLTNGFVSGPNGVDFVMRNGNSSDPNPTGLRVDLEGLVRIVTTTPVLSIIPTAPDTLSISWTPTDGDDQLQSAPAVTGPWTTISTVNPTTVYSTNAPAEFFRVLR